MAFAGRPPTGLPADSKGTSGLRVRVSVREKCSKGPGRAPPLDQPVVLPEVQALEKPPVLDQTARRRVAQGLIVSARCLLQGRILAGHRFARARYPVVDYSSAHRRYQDTRPLTGPALSKLALQYS